MRTAAGPGCDRQAGCLDRTGSFVPRACVLGEEKQCRVTLRPWHREPMVWRREFGEEPVPELGGKIIYGEEADVPERTLSPEHIKRAQNNLPNFRKLMMAL